MPNRAASVNRLISRSANRLSRETRHLLSGTKSFRFARHKLNRSSKARAIMLFVYPETIPKTGSFTVEAIQFVKKELSSM